MTQKIIKTIEDLSICTCPEPKSSRVLDWSHRSATHLCTECGGKYEKPSTERDYMEFFMRLPPPTLDL